MQDNIIRLDGIDFDTLIEQLLPINKMMSVIFDDGEVVKMASRNVIFHAYYWEVVRRWDFKLTSRYIVDTTVINSSTLSEIGTLILDDIITYFPDKVRDLNQDLWVTVNKLNQLATNHCQAYVRSLCALDFIKIKNIPEIKAITDDKVTDLSLGIIKSNEKIGRNTQRLFEELKKPHKDNAFYPFINLKLVNSTQIGHIFYQIGIRTDINESYIEQVVVGNYWDGLRNRNEYAYEAISAKKSIYYNKISLPDADYFGRKQHLALSSLEHIHKGDCKTDQVNNVVITELNKGYMLYKYIMDGDRLVLLTKKNVDNYLNKLVKMRSALTCRHTDGVCEVCGGKLIATLHPQINVGVYAGTKFSRVIVQTILKTKHVMDTNVMTYPIPKELTGIFKRTKHLLYVKRKSIKEFDKAVLILSPNDAIHVINLNISSMENLNAISEASFGLIHKISIRIGDEVIHQDVSMKSNSQLPLFSKALIKHIASTDEAKIIDNMFHVPLNGFDFDQPLFKITMVDYSMIKFTNQVKAFLESTISSYTDIEVVFSELCDLVYKQVSPNIIYTEMVLKAAMVRSAVDMRVPEVIDTSNVMIANNNIINSQRSLGTCLAFEDLFNTLKNPRTYLIPKKYNPFDEILHLKRLP